MKQAELVMIQEILQGEPRIKSGQNIYHSCSASHSLKAELCENAVKGKLAENTVACMCDS
jgi:hypothetical protein